MSEEVVLIPCQKTRSGEDEGVGCGGEYTRKGEEMSKKQRTTKGENTYIRQISEEGKRRENKGIASTRARSCTRKEDK